MRVARKVVCGYWKDEAAQRQIAVWARVAAGVADAKRVRCLMFGMNMNNVAVTDGDRVEFEQRMGYHVDYYPVSSLMEYFKRVTDKEADELVEEYKRLYTIKIDESGEPTSMTLAMPTSTTPTSWASTRFLALPHSA